MKRVWSVLLILISLWGCTPSPRMTRRMQILMGTLVEIAVLSTDEKKADKAITAAFEEIKRLEKLMSIFVDSSEFSRVNRAAGEKPTTVDPEVYDIVKRSLEFSDMTGGGFDLTIGPAVKLWAVNDTGHIPTEEETREVISLVDYRSVLLDPQSRSILLQKKGMLIDSGGIGKGYAADRAEKILKERGITAGVIALSGDLKLFGMKGDGKPWHIGIRHPRKTNALLASLDITDSAISTSGDYERFFIKDGVRYHHILDPKTLHPARGCQSVTIVAKEGIITDALSTGIFVMGPEKGMELIEKLPDVEGIIVDKEGRVRISSGLSGKITMEEE